MKIYNGEKWVNVAGDAGFNEEGILVVGGDNNRQIVVKDNEGEVLGILSRNGIELNNAKFNILQSETVLPIQRAVTYYVNSVTGDDSNDGLSEITAFKSISFAVSLLKNKQLVNSCYVNVASGEYDESIWVEGIGGAGIITFNFAANVIINGLVACSGCSNMISFVGKKTKINHIDDSFPYAFMANFSKHVRIDNFEINGQVNTICGVLAYRGSTISIKNSSVNNITNVTSGAIAGYECSQIFVENCIGSRNYRGVHSASGSFISIAGKTPVGTMPNLAGTGQIYGTATPTEFDGIVPSSPSTTSKTLTFNANSFRFWRTVINKWQNGVYIGDFSKSTSGSGVGGNNTSVLGMDMADIRNKLKNKKIVSVKLVMQRKTSGGYDSVTSPQIGLTTSDGAGVKPTIFKAISNLGGFTKGQSRTVSLPTSVITDIINNTSVKSFILYRDDEKQYSKYEDKFTLSVTYEETSAVLSDIPKTLEEPIF